MIDDVSIFYLQPTVNRLFYNCIKLYWYEISFSWNMKGAGGQIDPPSTPEKTTFKNSSIITI